MSDAVLRATLGFLRKVTRLADTFHFFVGPRASFDASAKMLLTRGYRL
jgi:hypothetical protein